VAAVAQHGRVGYLQAVGFQDLQTRAPMTERSLFRIYSMAKSVTAFAAMMLHEEHRFTLDDPVARYIAAFSKVVVADPSGGSAHTLA
jgi:CubicO group peptidase (beta-lactamase class C family)